MTIHALHYENLDDFYNWILSMKPRAVKVKGISQQVLYKIKSGKYLNPRVKVVGILLGINKE